jgi:hypothetical protein
MWFLPLIGAGLGAGGALAEGQEQSWAYEDEAQTAEKNAILAMREAEFNAYRQGVMATQVKGGIVADYGASGVTSDSGSVLDVLRQSHAMAELDRQNIMYGANVKVAQYQQAARAARAGAKQAKRAAQVNAATALFQGGTKALDRYSGGGNGKIGDNSAAFRSGNLSADSTSMSDGRSFGQRGV